MWWRLLYQNNITLFSLKKPNYIANQQPPRNLKQATPDSEIQSPPDLQQQPPPDLQQPDLEIQPLRNIHQQPLSYSEIQIPPSNLSEDVRRINMQI